MSDQGVCEAECDQVGATYWVGVGVVARAGMEMSPKRDHGLKQGWHFFCDDHALEIMGVSIGGVGL